MLSIPVLVFKYFHWTIDENPGIEENIRELAEVSDIIQKQIHYCKLNMIENDVLMIFYDLVISDVVKCP